MIGELSEMGWRVNWIEGRLYAPDGTYTPIGELKPSALDSQEWVALGLSRDDGEQGPGVREPRRHPPSAGGSAAAHKPHDHPA